MYSVICMSRKPQDSYGKLHSFALPTRCTSCTPQPTTLPPAPPHSHHSHASNSHTQPPTHTSPMRRGPNGGQSLPPACPAFRPTAAAQVGDSLHGRPEQDGTTPDGAPFIYFRHVSCSRATGLVSLGRERLRGPGEIRHSTVEIRDTPSSTRRPRQLGTGSGHRSLRQLLHKPLVNSRSRLCSSRRGRNIGTERASPAPVEVSNSRRSVGWARAGKSSEGTC